MTKLTVTKVQIGARRSGTSLPTSGDVTFSDGKDYGFIRDWQPDQQKYGGFTFAAQRVRYGSCERVSFQSLTRSAALEEFLKTAEKSVSR